MAIARVQVGCRWIVNNGINSAPEEMIDGAATSSSARSRILIRTTRVQEPTFNPQGTYLVKMIAVYMGIDPE